MEFYASCPAAFEQPLAVELRDLGLQRVRPLKGRVAFEGGPRDAYRACLWSHLASRIYVVLGRVPCDTADALYHATYELPWQSILRPGSSIAISARGTNDTLRNTRFSMLRAKDAIVDRLLDETGTRPAIDAHAPDARLLLSIRGNRASISFDLSGEALFKRLARGVLSHAPAGVDILRPDHAALLLAAAHWPEQCREARATGTAPLLVDAACGEGGVLLEATLWMHDRAPGMTRPRWGFHAWGAHDASAWRAELAEARQRAEEGAACRGHIIATDIDPQAIEAAKRIAMAAGIDSQVTFCEADVAALDAAVAARAPHASRRHESLKGGAGTLPLHGSVIADLSPMNTSILPIGMRFFADACTHDGLAALPAASLGRAGVVPHVPGHPVTHTQTVALGNDELTLAAFDPAGKKDATSEPIHETPVQTKDERVIEGSTSPDAPANRQAARPPEPTEHSARETSGAARNGAAREDTVKEPHDPASSSAAYEDAAEAPRDTAPVSAASGDAPRDAAAAAPRGVSASSTKTPRTPTVDVGSGKPIPLIVPESEQFAHRLIKVARQRRRWAKRAGVTCYRVYDADLPDYSAAIDLYVGDDRTPGRWLVIAEYAAPKTVDPVLAQNRMMDILAIAPRVLDVPLDHVHAKTRMRSRGGSQYGARGAGTRRANRSADQTEQPVYIQEGGLTFAVEFGERLDTGIFLDHRITRGLVRKQACHARNFLNLFAYTGTATCYAADGGAHETTTVDLSNTYLDWAAYNMELNGFTDRGHRFVRDDVLTWIDDARYRRERWDLIFCDPPTFSNSSRMGARTFDVQRDHVELLEAVTQLLAPSGVAIFSCNLRSFKPDISALKGAGVSLEDITAQTIPEDFQRNQRIHHCYLARRA